MSDNTEDQIAPNEPALKDGSSSFGSFYPKNYVLAVFVEHGAAEQAASAAHAAGFAEDDVIVASGADVVAHARDAQAEQGILSKMGEMLSKLYTDESADSHTLVSLAGAGATFVLVYAPEDDDTAKAATTLRAFGPAIMRKYGTLAIAELS